MSKKRLSVSVDAELIEEGRAAVAAGLHHNMSAWVNAALREQSEHDRRLRAADEFFKWYEAEYGEITEEMMDAADREMRARAIVVRGDLDTGPADAPPDADQRSA